MDYMEIYKQQRGELKKQQKKLAEAKDTDNFPSIIDKGNLKVPIWRPKAGKHLFDIIPYITGKDDPIEKPNMLKVALALDVHTRIGAMKEQFVCPAKAFKKPCPICAYLAQNDVDTKTWSSLSPKVRVFYLVWVRDSKADMQKGIQLLEMAHFSMQEQIDSLTSIPPIDGDINEEGDTIAYADLINGKSIYFERIDKGKEKVRYIGFALHERRSPIPKGLLKQVFPIDSIIKMHPEYNEIQSAFLSGKHEGSQETEVDAFAGTEEAKTGASDDLDFDEGFSLEDETPSKTSKKEPEDNDAFGNDDFGFEEDEGTASLEDDTCPEGGEFGADCDKYKACDGCSNYDSCSDKAVELVRAKKKAKK